MDSVKSHTPVLLQETLHALAPIPGGRYLDGTVGLGGHAGAILNAAPGARVCGLDRDSEALAIAGAKLGGGGARASLFRLPFSRFDEALEKLGWKSIDGALLDIGVSSLQLDTDERGFSFSGNGMLDMRMDSQSGSPSAWHLVNRENFDFLRNCIATLGEDPQAGRIARQIVAARQKGPINTTAELARIVEQAYPPAWRRSARRHPATKTFQALRMAVNNELEELGLFLDKILSWLPAGGRLAIITFHSLEDRMVKRAMRGWAQDCACLPDLPQCVGPHSPRVRLLNKKPVRASDMEVAANPRSRSAKLRAIEKISRI